MTDQVFLPEVWSGAMLEVLRSNIAIAPWGPPAAQTDVEKAESVKAYLAREAQRQADLAAMEARLKTFTGILQPIILLHARDGYQCVGCDVDGYECEQPEWPCRTIKTILGETVD